MYSLVAKIGVDTDHKYKPNALCRQISATSFLPNLLSTIFQFMAQRGLQLWKTELIAGSLQLGRLQAAAGQDELLAYFAHDQGTAYIRGCQFGS